jgi:1-pyrroline-5-carboxylate dehydrogenase
MLSVATLLQRGVSSSAGRSALLAAAGRRGFSSKLLDSFATVDPEALSGAQPYQVYNIVKGGWTLPQASTALPDPLTGEPFLKIPDTQEGELQQFVESLAQVPKSGLHNPFKVTD